MNFTIKTFDDFRHNMFPAMHVGRKNAYDEIQRLTVNDIDTFLLNREYDFVRILGLQQDTFEYFVEKYGARFKGISFCRNRAVSDWSALAKLSSVEYLDLHGNYEMTSLWDMSSNRALKALAISNCTKLHSICGVEKAPSLDCLILGEGVWPSAVIDSLAPLAGTKIQYLEFTGKKIEDNDISFIWDMPELKQFNCPTNLFTTEQIAWAVSNFPDLEGYALRAKISWGETESGHDVPTTLIVGKRKPCLPTKGNEEKIQRYVDRFDSLVASYKGVRRP